MQDKTYPRKRERQPNASSTQWHNYFYHPCFFHKKHKRLGSQDITQWLDLDIGSINKIRR